MSKKLRSGDCIKLLDFDPPKPAYIMDLLATQMTVQYMDGTGTLSFRFYRDEGVTWKRGEKE